MENNVFTFNQFMQATKHLDEVAEEKTDAFVIPKAEKTFMLLPIGALPTDAEAQYFYTKGEAKDFANKQTADLRWFKKDSVIYAKDSEGNVKYYIYQSVTE